MEKKDKKVSKLTGDIWKVIVEKYEEFLKMRRKWLKRQEEKGFIWIFKSQINQPWTEAALAKKNTEQVFNQHRRCSADW